MKNKFLMKKQRKLVEEQKESLENKNRYVFLVAKNRDLFIIKKNHTGSNKTEVHVLSAESNYRNFIVQTGTDLEETYDNFEFGLNGNRDLVIIKKNHTGSNKTEVHVLSAASKYQHFTVHKGTPMEETYDNFSFLVADNGDVYGIKKSETGSHSTEVHILTERSSYQNWGLHTGTPLEETGLNFSFGLTKNNDLVAIKKSSTGSNSTEVHILSAQGNYQNWTLHTGTRLEETFDNFSFGIAENNDLFIIKRNKTGSNSTEVHVLSAHGNYQNFVTQTGTGLHET